MSPIIHRFHYIIQTRDQNGKNLEIEESEKRKKKEERE